MKRIVEVKRAEPENVPSPKAAVDKASAEAEALRRRRAQIAAYI